MNTLIILDEDKTWARTRIAELDAQIQALGPEFNDVFNQSSETWHDNAPFEALRDRQTLLDAERQQLKAIVRESALEVPKAKKGRVGIGSLVTLQSSKGKEATYKIAGDWTPRAGQLIEKVRIVSCQSSLAKAVLDGKVNDETPFGIIVGIV